jgi:beta-phosphoglucomutase-like phosphatase (HAD superfamily)|tara:strand:- start:500 stop:688 length:189 start_codon:yes stop_codon:yes gene_type:complete
MVNNQLSLGNFFNKAKVIFWDFDGVIKDSVNVKTRAFEKLFLPFGENVVNVKLSRSLYCFLK